MKKIILLLIFSAITTLVWSQPPPPPPPPPSGTAAPIDTDVLYFIIPAALFAVYRLNKKRAGLVTDLK